MATKTARSHYERWVQGKPKKLSAYERREKALIKKQKREKKAERKRFGIKIERAVQHPKFEPATILRKAV